MLHKPLHTHGEDEGRYHLQPLRDGSHTEGDSHEEHIEDVLTVEDTEDKDQHADAEGEEAEDLAELIEPLLERHLLLLGLGEHLSNVSHLGLHTGSHDDALATTVGDETGGEGDIGAVTDR